MRRNRGFACPVHELIQMVGGMQDAYRRHTNCGSAPVMLRRNPSWIGSLMKFPERHYPWVDTLRTSQQFSADTGMRNRSFCSDDRSSDSDRALGIIGGLADSPLMLCIACISRDYGTRRPFEASDALRVPAEDVGVRQHLRLLPDRITSRDSFEAAVNAINYRDGHERVGTCSWRPSH